MCLARLSSKASDTKQDFRSAVYPGPGTSSWNLAVPSFAFGPALAGLTAVAGGNLHVFGCENILMFLNPVRSFGYSNSYISYMITISFDYHERKDAWKNI